jgi:hypothetical protein
MLKSLSPYLFMHMKNVQIGCCTCLVRQFEGKVILDPEIDSKLDSAIPNWIGSPLLGVHLLALQHPLDVLHVLHDPLLHLTGARGLIGAKEEGDAQGLGRV